MDPKQRIILELCWEALEDAGMIRAGRPLGETGDVFDWPAWNVCGDRVEIAADHFAVIEASSVATAEATEEWLTADSPSEEG